MPQKNTLYFHSVVEFPDVCIKVSIYVNLKTLTRPEMVVKVLLVFITTI
jgi:hypothetical protein